ncbi:hypothetical protein RYX36_010862 [Vicia faba]
MLLIVVSGKCYSCEVLIVTGAAEAAGLNVVPVSFGVEEESGKILEDSIERNMYGNLRLDQTIDKIVALCHLYLWYTRCLLKVMETEDDVFLVFEYFDVSLKRYMAANYLLFDSRGQQKFQMGNPCYKAPELLMGSTRYSIAVVIWSMDCIFAEMIKLKPLFVGSDEPEMLTQIFW